MNPEEFARHVYTHHHRPAKLKARRGEYAIPEWSELGLGERKLRIAAAERTLAGYFRADATESRIDR